jgi:hypothetical protein
LKSSWRIEERHESADGVEQCGIDWTHVNPPHGRARGLGVGTIGEQFPHYRLVEGKADGQARLGGRRLDDPSADRKIDRHEECASGVVTVHLVS